MVLMGLVPPHLKRTPLGVSIIVFRTCSGLGSGLLQVAGMGTILRMIPEKDIAMYVGMV